MPTYILRDLPPGLWGEVQAKAKQGGWPLRALILALLRDYAEDRVRPSQPPPPPAFRE